MNLHGDLLKEDQLLQHNTDLVIAAETYVITVTSIYLTTYIYISQQLVGTKYRVLQTES